MHEPKLLEKELGSRPRRLFASRRFGAARKNNRQITAMRRAGNGVSLQWPQYISQMRVPKAQKSAFRDFFCRISAELASALDHRSKRRLGAPRNGYTARRTLPSFSTDARCLILKRVVLAPRDTTALGRRYLTESRRVAAQTTLGIGSRSSTPGAVPFPSIVRHLVPPAVILEPETLIGSRPSTLAQPRCRPIARLVPAVDKPVRTGEIRRWPGRRQGPGGSARVVYRSGGGERLPSILLARSYSCTDPSAASFFTNSNSS